MKTQLDDYEKAYLLSLKGKFNHIENVEMKILAIAYALDEKQVTVHTKNIFVRGLYIKLIDLGVIVEPNESSKYLIERLTTFNKNPFETMESDMRWLNKYDMEKVEIYNLDYSFLN